MTHLTCHLQWSEMSGSTRIHSSCWQTDRREGAGRKNIKTPLAGGQGRDTNTDMIRGAVSLCVTMCGRQKKERGGHRRTEGEGALCSRTSGWSGRDQSWPHVSRTVTAVKRRHARLSVKLETTGAQLTTKSLIVKTSVHSHSRGIVGGG